MSLPDFLVIGAQRAGSTLLYQILLGHPQVYVPVRRKEVHYFDRYFERGVEWYESYFPAGGEAARYRAIGEVTPDYLAAPEAPGRIRQVLPRCRLIAILRNPVDRAYSWYQHARRSRNERRDLATFLEQDSEGLRAGLYHRHLQNYLAVFPREALLVLIFEEVLRDPARELGRLAEFLGIDAWSDPAALLRERVYASDLPRFRQGFALARRAGGFLTHHDLNWPVRIAKRLGVPRWFGRSPPAPPLSAAERECLAAYYRDDVRQLAALLDRDLDIWQG